ncbi:GIY-YIG nuclease family protein [Vibrio cholerae]|uniref:GIY-YIG nuclease family protein n=1 Tax=Vibrio cholerae TaxID=666 RepID=UPI0004E394BA|nr:GIY-YIG nuclease family protein [Vibrio cholerae]EGR1091208.1 GIY-YIG nuclease family protein [Vibrio cholerae]KFE23567.1 meiotically up-regulated 113 family protein [Vibrio cholerae]TXZ35711.1 GIY-YIG nuclease family protein [Vibrio cholerae]BCK29655.1 hypothetical protein VCSRO77_3070 [Vibrio cholerae]
MESKGLLYFIQGQTLSHVKIGYSTSRSLFKRLKELQTGSPDKLILLSVKLVSRADEAELHKRFSNSRLHGEWFSYTEDLQEYIKANTLHLNERLVLGMSVSGEASATTFALSKYLDDPTVYGQLNEVDLDKWFLEEVLGIL